MSQVVHADRLRRLSAGEAPMEPAHTGLSSLPSGAEVAPAGAAEPRVKAAAVAFTPITLVCRDIRCVWGEGWCRAWAVCTGPGHALQGGSHYRTQIGV